MEEDSSAFNEYLLALLTTLAAIALRLALDPILGNQFPFTTLYAAVAFTVWIHGYRPAILVMILCYFSANYLFIEPRHTISITEIHIITASAAYFITCLIIIALGQSLRKSQRKLRERQEALQSLNFELNQKMDEFNTLLSILPIGVWIGNSDCSEIRGNAAAYQIYSHWSAGYGNRHSQRFLTFRF